MYFKTIEMLIKFYLSKPVFYFVEEMVDNLKKIRILNNYLKEKCNLDDLENKFRIFFRKKYNEIKGETVSKEFIDLIEHVINSSRNLNFILRKNF